MKRIIWVALIASVLPIGPAKADPNTRVVGAVLGTAAGLIIANNVHGVNPWIAAPVGAVLGGYIGSQYDRHEEWAYARRGHTRYRDGYRHDYPYAGPYPYYAEPPPTVVYVQEKAQVPEKPRVVAFPTDPHPGVDLIKVSILNSNGIRTDVPILRIKEKFIGPQGESYETLPTAETLAKRYGM